jgi:hypothetical protein
MQSPRSTSSGDHRSRSGSGWPIARADPATSLQEIENVCIDQSSWSEFWGIRFTARGLLLNISGLDAVELDFKNGGMIRVGTNEPEQLAKAIEDELIARKRQEHHRVI